jgi:hypothetical protein
VQFKGTERDPFLNPEIFSIPDASSSGRRQLLRKPIYAIQLVPKSGSKAAKLGLMLQLPMGSTVEICGIGFNERTVKVRANDLCYFVFTEELESQRSSAA